MASMPLADARREHQRRRVQAPRFCGTPLLRAAARTLALTIALVTHACGADPEAKDSGGGALPTDSGGFVGFDAGFGSSSDTDAAAGRQDALAADVEGTDSASTRSGCEFASSPGPGEAGSSCAENADCDSAFCVQTASGGRCSRTCTDCCPTGWGCAQAPGRDAVYVCLPRLEALCLPCQDDAACAARNAGALCLAYADGADQTVRFCGGACAKDDDCPSGYQCADGKGTQGEAKQCRLAAGFCACGPVAKAEGLLGACTVSNVAGICAGTRSCLEAGLSACSAATPAAESCDGVDDDCDGATDEEIGPAACAVSNAHGSCAGTETCGGGKATCDAATPAAESCNGADDDCDGKTDEGCDDDADGYCAAGVVIAGLPASCGEPGGCGAAAMPAWCSKGIGDCADGDAQVHPGAAEACGNAKDDDCDGKTDAPGADTAGATVAPSGCKTFYADADADGAGAVGTSACLCAASPAFPALDAKDCDDGDKAVHPGAEEICGNGKDDDCDGDENEENAKNCTTFYIDKDGDGYGKGVPSCLCAAKGDHKAVAAGDCDDDKKAVSPVGTETCDGLLDEDCDGSTDEEGAKDCKAWYVDGDKDGWGDLSKSACLCAAAGAFATLQGGDCNDGNPQAHKGATELCNDSADNDCDGGTDEEGAKNCTDWYFDGDKDGYGAKDKKKCLCDKGDVQGYSVSKGSDCDDGSAAISPEAKEVCDGKDNDCDFAVDPGCDADGDGYCDAGKTTVGKPAACPKGGGDCNDDATGGGKAIFPGAKETCNGKDDNCEAGLDEGCDDDGDGYCDKAMTLVGSPAVCSQGGGDCQDGDKAIHPDAKEVCNDKDDDCDATTDDGCDDDNDGYCDKAMTVVGTPKTCAKGGGDCCDLDVKAFPGQSSFFSSANKCSSFDYNCSGSSEKQLAILAQPKHICEGFACINKAECIADPEGWLTTVPACGASGTWVTDYQWDGSLTLPLVNTCKTSVTSQQTQACK